MSGSTIPKQLEDFVSRERESGVYLSILGFGGGNYNDLLMQKLAQSGNGMAAYIDNLNEGRKVLNDDLSGSMFSIADDVKIQVEFNPAKVAEYRLIGYETRILNKEDFNNDKVDAGEIGAGTSVTAIYEITPVGSKATLIDPSRYQTRRSRGPGQFERVRLPEDALQDAGRGHIQTCRSADHDSRSGLRHFEGAGIDAVCDGGGGLWIDAARRSLSRQSVHAGISVIDLANGAKGEDEFGYRAEFVQLARLAKTAASQETLKSAGQWWRRAVGFCFSPRENRPGPRNRSAGPLPVCIRRPERRRHPVAPDDEVLF